MNSMLNRGLKDNAQVLKGMLILLVIIGHSDLYGYPCKYIGPFIYSFHVTAFFLLAFLSEFKTPNKNLSDRIAKLIIPYVIFSLIYAGLFSIYSGFGVREALEKFFIGVLLSNYWSVKEATGFMAMWFLPAFFVALIIHDRLAGAARQFRPAVIVVSLFVHCFIGELDDNYLRLIPWGVWVCFYIWIIGEILNFFMGLLYDKGLERIFYTGSLFVFCISCFFVVYYDNRINISWGNLPSIRTPLWLLVHDLLAISCMGALLFLVNLIRKVKMLVWFGKNSMPIYLVHMSIYFLVKTVFKMTLGSGKIQELIVLSLTIFISALTVSRLHSFSRISHLIFPKDWSEFVSSFRNVRLQSNL